MRRTGLRLLFLEKTRILGSAGCLSTILLPLTDYSATKVDIFLD